MFGVCYFETTIYVLCTEVTCSLSYLSVSLKIAIAEALKKTQEAERRAKEAEEGERRARFADTDDDLSNRQGDGDVQLTDIKNNNASQVETTSEKAPAAIPPEKSGGCCSVM